MAIETDSLESLCELIVDCPHSTPKWTDHGVVVLRNQNIRNGTLDLSDPSFTNEEDYQKRIKRAVPQAGDIVFTREAPMGEVCLVPDDLKCCLGQRQVLLRPRKDVSGEYLFWALQSPFVQHQISWNEGTGTTVSNVRIPVLKSLQIPRHPQDEAKAASMLSALANKIQLNRQTNQTLEAMAQALFKSWFVDFDPVIDNALAAGHEIPPELQARAEARKSLQARAEQRKASLSGDRSEHESGDILPESIRQLFPNRFVLDAQMGWIPEGWEITQIKDVAGVVKGKSYKSAELAESKTALVTLKSFNRGGGYRLDGLKEYTGSYKPEQEVFAGDLVIAYTDVTQAADVIGKPAMVVSDSRYEHLVVSLDVAVVRPKLDSLKYFLYGLAQTRQFQDHTHSHSTGTTVLHLSKDAVPDYCFALPDGEVLRIYERMVKQNFESIDLNISSLRTLEKLRDTLLPKLISGELRLPDEQQPAKTVTT